MIDKLLTWDRETFIYLNNLGIEAYDQFWAITTTISTWTPLFLVFIFLLFQNVSPKKAAVRLGYTVVLLLVVHGLTWLTKALAKRIRPNLDDTVLHFTRIVQASEGYSFFSGHASFSFALTTFMVLMLKNKYRWVWICYAWALLLVGSRIYVGVHYPLDLIAGALVGSLLAYMFYLLYLKFTKHETR